MNCIVIDTETSGFIDTNLPASKQAWVVQVSAKAFDMDSWNLVAQMNSFIRPDGRTVSEGAFKVHGLSTDFLQRYGDSEDYTCYRLNHLVDYISPIECVIGHNIDFDINMLSYMFARNSLPNIFLNYPQFCTMQNSIDLCKLPSKSKGKFKRPKLSELYQFLFGKQPDNLHNASDDVDATYACFKHPLIQEIYNQRRS